MSVFSLYLGLKLLLLRIFDEYTRRSWEEAHRIAIKSLQNYFSSDSKKKIFKRLRIRTKVDVALSI